MTLQLQPLPDSLVNYARSQIDNQILPYWMKQVVNPNGGLYGAVTDSGSPVAGAKQGSIMNARALWSFSAAFEVTRNPAYLINANHVFKAINQHFFDPDFGGIVWSLDTESQIADGNKQLIAQAYTLFALSRYHRVQANDTALQLITALVEMINQHFLRDDGSYCAGLTREFRGQNSAMNLNETCAHLHLLEALTELYLVLPSPELANQLTSLTDLFTSTIFPASQHLTLLFDRLWQPTGKEISYGHNLEAPFLVWLACATLGDWESAAKVQSAMIPLLEMTLTECRHSSGSLLRGIDQDGKVHTTLSWWQQTETSNALLLAYQLTGEQRYFKELTDLWQTIKTHWVDNNGKEWFTELNLNLKPTGNSYRADIWRCAYHGSRACLMVGYDLYLKDFSKDKSRKMSDAAIVLQSTQ